MKTWSVGISSSIAALLLFGGSIASAAEPPPAEAAPPPPAAPAAPATQLAPARPDGARFRGGVAAEGGALIIPGVMTLGIAGIQGQLGAQINNMIGVYAIPNFDVVFGSVGGVNLAFAVMVDFTLLDDAITVGAGPDLGVFGAIGVSSTSATAAGGALYGARLHFSWNPIVSHDDNRARRKALAIGADLRLLAGGAGFASTSSSEAGTTATAAGSTFVLAPQITIGYAAF